MTLLNKIKQGTWLFTDNQIKNKILDMQSHPEKYNDNGTDAGYIILYLYKDKGNLSKEEYKSEILNYINYWSRDSEEKIKKVLTNYKPFFYEDYENAIQNKISFYHAVENCRYQLMSKLHYKFIEDSLLFSNTELDDLEEDDDPDF